jgi:hypothetical protein
MRYNVNIFISKSGNLSKESHKGRLLIRFLYVIDDLRQRQNVWQA